MSMDLYVWKRPLLDDPAEALRLVNLDDESVFEQSADLERFYAELLERFPPPEAFSPEEQDGAPIPWADSPSGSDRLVWLSIRWSADDEHLDAIVELARAYDLVLYDPQGPSFHSPANEHEGEPYVPTVGEYVRAVLLILFGVGLAYVAWRASVPVLSWILVFVGGFVTLVAVVGFVATARQSWRVRASRGP